jgi:hypothetical protein
MVSIQAPSPDLEIPMAQPKKTIKAETTQDVSITSWKLHSTRSGRGFDGETWLEGWRGWVPINPVSRLCLARLLAISLVVMPTFPV